MDKGLPLLRVTGLSLDAGNNQLLDIENLCLTNQGPTMILGPNGAGKSLFLRLLHGLIAPKSGSIQFRGREPDVALRRRQAMVFQTPVLLRRSVAANIAYALKVHGVKLADRAEKISNLLAAGDLTDKARQPARTLSGGEQQRLALVRALANEPDTLFLDEPTSSLDPGACRAIEKMIEGVVKSGTKVIMVTHDLGVAQRVGENIIFMRKGKILETTDANVFFADPQSEKARAFLASRLVL